MSTSKRILAEAKELSRAHGADGIVAGPLEDDMYTWHFTMSGPDGTPFEGGLYHGKIQLRYNYPFAPPDLAFFTPNGRWETNKAICLTFTGYHIESWQPAWGVRTALLAVQALMSSEDTDNLGIGSIRSPPYECQRLAQRSREWTCTDCGKSNADILQEAKESKPENATPPSSFRSELPGSSLQHRALETAHQVRNVQAGVHFPNDPPVMPNSTPSPQPEFRSSSPDTPPAVSLRALEPPTDADVPPKEKRVQIDAERNASQDQDTSIFSAPPKVPIPTAAAPPPASPSKPEPTPSSNLANVAPLGRPLSHPAQTTVTIAAEYTPPSSQTEAQGTPTIGNAPATQPTPTQTSHSIPGVPLPSTILRQRRTTPNQPTPPATRTPGSTGPVLPGGRTWTPTSSLHPSTTPTAAPTGAPAEPNGNFLRTQLLQQRRTQLQSRRNTFDGLITLVSFVLLIMLVRGIVVPMLNRDDSADYATGG